MSTRLTIALPTLLAVGILPAFAEAQLVQVRRGYIRTPFVRIERRSGLNMHVQTPLVELGGDQPQYAYPPGPSYQQPLPPNVAPPAQAIVPMDVAGMDWLTLRKTVRDGETELDRQLDRFGTAEQWKKSLQIGALNELLAVDVNTPPASGTRDQLQPILDTYDRVQAEPAFRQVSQLSGFQTVQRALYELLLSPQDRQRGRLITAAGQLDNALSRMQNGPSWSEHLRLPDSVFVSDEPADGQVALQESIAEPQRAELTPVLDRFDAVSSDPRYGAVTSLPAFQSTHLHLRTYVQLLSPPSPPAPPADTEIIIRQKPQLPTLN